MGTFLSATVGHIDFSLLEVMFMPFHNGLHIKNSLEILRIDCTTGIHCLYFLNNHFKVVLAILLSLSAKITGFSTITCLDI